MSETGTNQYALAGWLAIVSAVLVVPEIALVVLSKLEILNLEYIVQLIHTVNMVISIYILYMFRRLLNRQFDFRAADLTITILIVINLVSFVIGLGELSLASGGAGADLESHLMLYSVLIFIVFSIVSIVFGAVLLKMRDDLFGLLKPYAYLTIVGGVCGVCIFLLPIALIAGLLALVIQGMIFLRADREAEIL